MRDLPTSEISRGRLSFGGMCREFGKARFCSRCTSGRARGTSAVITIALHRAVRPRRLAAVRPWNARAP